MLSADQIEAIVSRGTAALDKRSPLARPGYNRRDAPGHVMLDSLLAGDPEWRGLTDRQKDMIGLRFWQGIDQRGRQQPAPAPQ